MDPDRTASTCLFYYEGDCPLLTCDMSAYGSLNSVEIMALEGNLRICKLIFKHKMKMRTVLQLLQHVGMEPKNVEDELIVTGRIDRPLRQHPMWKKMERNMHSNPRRDLDRERYVDDGLLTLRTAAMKESVVIGEGAKVSNINNINNSAATNNNNNDERAAQLLEHEAAFRRERESFMGAMQRWQVVEHMQQALTAKLNELDEWKRTLEAKSLEEKNLYMSQRGAEMAALDASVRKLRAAALWQRLFYKTVLARRQLILEGVHAEVERERHYMQRKMQELEEEVSLAKRRRLEPSVEEQQKQWDREIAIFNTKCQPFANLFDNDPYKTKDAMDWLDDIVGAYKDVETVGTMYTLKRMLRAPAFRKDAFGVATTGIESDTKEDAIKLLRRMLVYYHPDKQSDPVLTDQWRIFSGHMTRALTDLNASVNSGDFRPTTAHRLFPLCQGSGS